MLSGIHPSLEVLSMLTMFLLAVVASADVPVEAALTPTVGGAERQAASEGLATESLPSDAPSRPSAAAKVSRFANVLLSGFQGGWLLGTKLWVSPVREDMSGSEWLRVQGGLNRTIGPVAPFMMGGTALLNALPFLFDRDFRKASVVLTAIGLLLNSALIVTTIVGNVPVNDVTRVADPNHPPPGWRQLRSRWETFHTVRSGLSIAAFGCNLAAVTFH